MKPRVVRPPPLTASGSNPFAKSNALDRKPIPIRSTPSSPAATSPRRVSSSNTPAQTTPRATRTKESPLPAPEKVRTPVKSKPVVVASPEVTPRAVRIAARSGNVDAGNAVSSGKRNNGVTDADLELVAVGIFLFLEKAKLITDFQFFYSYSG